MGKGPDDEAKEAYGRADHCDPEGVRGRDEDGRFVPQIRDQRSPPSTTGKPSTAGWRSPRLSAEGAGERERIVEHGVRQQLLQLGARPSTLRTAVITAQQGNANRPTPIVTR